ncbi:Uncharacterized protein TCM_025963 [Theobroma cacao]|uniref:Uncharacterized protein n=1 Tax=Theobroma cacao TaxID=3641 RepID=A0A061F1Z2_THECC|nr:Uncharacterized protein TCM_025963 [Theobroma cacao]
MEVEEAEDQDLHLSLKTFSVSWSDALTDLPRLLLEGSASTLQSIKIGECENIEVLPEWLQNLTSLQKLEISYCPNLSSPPEGMDRLTALTQLKIKGCPTLSRRWRPVGGRPVKELPIGIKEQQADLVMDKSTTACTLWKLSLCLLQSREPCIHVRDCDFN